MRNNISIKPISNKGSRSKEILCCFIITAKKVCVKTIGNKIEKKATGKLNPKFCVNLNDLIIQPF